MEKLTKEYSKLVERQARFSQQQFLFVGALQESKKSAGTELEPVRTLQEVALLLESHVERATHDHIFRLFLELCDDMEGFRKELRHHLQKSVEGSPNGKLKKDPRVRQISLSLKEWGSLLNPNKCLTGVRAKYPIQEMNRLSCNEAKNYYGGVISLLPVLLNIAGECVSDLRTLDYSRDYDESQPITPPQSTDDVQSLSKPSTAQSSISSPSKARLGYRPASKKSVSSAQSQPLFTDKVQAEGFSLSRGSERSSQAVPRSQGRKSEISGGRQRVQQNGRECRSSDSARSLAGSDCSKCSLSISGSGLNL